MPIRIPTYENRVQVDTPTVPNAPSPGVVKDAFGGQVFAANEALGKAGVNIGEALAKRAQEKQILAKEQFNAQSRLSAKSEIDSFLNDTSEEIVKINGQEIKRPKGLLARQLGNAEGSLIEYREKGSKVLDKYLGQIQDPTYRTKLGLEIGEYLRNKESEVVRHENTQVKKNQVNIFKADVERQIEEGQSIQDPQKLLAAMENVTLAQDTLNKAQSLDTDTSLSNIRKANANLVRKSVTNTFFNTGDLSAATAVLDGVKDKISLDTYNSIAKSLRTGSANLERQLQQETIKQKTVNRFNFATQVASGEIDWKQSPELVKEVAMSDPELAEAVQRVIDSGNRYDANEEQNESYANLVNGIFSAGSQEEISKFLVDALNAKSNGEISRDRLAILINAAQNRANGVAPLKSEAKNAPKNAKQTAVDSGFKAAQSLYDKYGKDPEILDNYLLNVSEGKNPQEALNITMTTAAIKRNPALSALPEIPNETLNSGGTVDANIPGTRNLKTDNKAPQKSYKIMQDKKTGIRARVYEDGKVEVIK